MEAKDLKNATLSAGTRDYLTVYVKLMDIYNEVCSIAERIYGKYYDDCICNDVGDALAEAQREVMKLVETNIMDHIYDLENHTKL